MKILLTPLLVAFCLIQNIYSNTIDLSSFKITLSNQQVELNWACELPEKNCMFIVERGDQGFQFFSIDTILAKDGHQSYNCFDKSPLKGLSYYRLKCINENKVEFFSKIESVDICLKAQSQSFEIVSLFPIPFAKEFSISVKCKYSIDLALILRDQTGKVLYQSSERCVEGYNTFKLSEVEGFKNDTYYLTISDDHINTKTLYVLKHNN